MQVLQGTAGLSHQKPSWPEATEFNKEDTSAPDATFFFLFSSLKKKRTDEWSKMKGAVLQFWGIMSVVREQTTNRVGGGRTKIKENPEALPETPLLESPEIILDKPTNICQAKEIPQCIWKLKRRDGRQCSERDKKLNPYKSETWGTKSCRAKTLIPRELQCKLSSTRVLGGRKEVESAADCVILLQVCSEGGAEDFAGGAEATAAGDQQPERKIGLLWSWMLCASQCEAADTERGSQSGEGK